MRDPLKEPKYGDLFEWKGTTTGSQVVVMFLALANRKGYWSGLRIGPDHVHVSHDWLPLAEPWNGQWRVVEAAR